MLNASSSALLNEVDVERIASTDTDEQPLLEMVLENPRF
jgi:hypothetical protein